MNLSVKTLKLGGKGMFNYSSFLNNPMHFGMSAEDSTTINTLKTGSRELIDELANRLAISLKKNYMHNKTLFIKTASTSTNKNFQELINGLI